MNTASIKKGLLKPMESNILTGPFVGFGSVLLNLAVTGNSRKGIQAGTYCLMVGDSDSGKTYITLAVEAEASINPAFDDYRLIYDGPEYGAKMDLVKCYGQKLADKIEIVEPSSTVEEFYDRTDDDQKGDPFIKILDSMDALSTMEEEEQVKKEKGARKSGKEVSGSFGTSKAKANKRRLRTIVNQLPKNGSILIIISQTIDNIGYGAFMNPKSRAGGKSLKFFADTEIWLSSRGLLTVPYGKKKVQVGNTTVAKVKRSRHTGKKREIEFPIYHSSEIDDMEV